jgi:hypothetical protein
LLVWDKDSYTERFLALLPCTCVLQPEFVCLYQTSSLLVNDKISFFFVSPIAFLLVYINCTKEFYCDTYMQACNVLWADSMPLLFFHIPFLSPFKHDF